MVPKPQTITFLEDTVLVVGLDGGEFALGYWMGKREQ